MTHFAWLALIPLAPLVGALYNGLLGARMQKRGKAWVHIPAVLLPGISCGVTLWAFAALIRLDPEHRALFCHLWDWMPVGDLDASIALFMDPLTLVMCMVVTFVGTLIHIYSIGYMREEPSYWRFFCYLNLFMFSMLVLVLADNFLFMFVGWEGVGLCSYLLISFWYKDSKNAAAGMKAFVVNRIGDFGVLLAVFLLFWSLSDQKRSEPATDHAQHGSAAAQVFSEHKNTSVRFKVIEEILEDEEVRQAFASRTIGGVNLVALIGVLFFLGAMGKSAQIPLYVWLPDAMAGPTPVSALIHAATMVTAGVYMVARLHFIFALSPLAMTWVTTIGALTAVFAATIGFFQHDIKKVLAYSTVSQLGYMFIAVGVGAYAAGVFHLMTHAFFKACLFLGSGSVIMGCHHEQDMRHMGGLRKKMPITGLTYFVACCAIAGFPLTAGFFSKDEILWKAFNTGNLILPGGGLLIWAMAALGALCTSFYMFRSYYMTFSGDYRGGHEGGGQGDAHSGHPAEPHESPWSMTGVLSVLAVLSLVGGFVGLPHFLHLPNLFHGWLEPVFESSAGLIHEAGHGVAAEVGLMGASVLIALTGWGLARWLYIAGQNPIPHRLYASESPMIRGIHRLVYNKYYVDEFYNATVVWAVLKLRKALDAFDSEGIDRLVNMTSQGARALAGAAGATDSQAVDGAVNEVARDILRGGKGLRILQNGNLRTYLYVVMTGAMALILVHELLLK